MSQCKRATISWAARTFSAGVHGRGLHRVQQKPPSRPLSLSLLGMPARGWAVNTRSLWGPIGGQIQWGKENGTSDVLFRGAHAAPA